MQLFLISKSRKKSLSITFGPITLCVCMLVMLGAGLMVFHAGSHYALSLTKDSFKSLYSQTAPLWNREIKAQQQMLSQAKENAEKNLDALATRLSKLQAHIMRLDALGSRLADMADLDEIEFDVASTPGLGGPNPTSLHGSMEVSDFLDSLEDLNSKIQDREEKLAAMESMLIDRTLRNQTIPTGSPTADGWISSLFGMRTDPMTGKMEFHGGVDYAGKSGSPILAVGSGIVTWSGIRYGYGNMVEINHGNGYQTRYAHNKKNLVVVGQKVDKGQIIALMGSSGRATGPHVHFEVVNNGKVVNPKKYISLK
ncbi:MAG: M23 family metallopeptidase [Proteobacteria bacterium]|nr:M23 family metallopeptidase [Pseudomonadota bacterium]